MTNKNLESYIPFVRFLAAVCGPHAEVVLHDLTDLDHSIIAIENGYISNRKVGDGLRDYALEGLYQTQYTDNDFITNIQGNADSGRQMRYSIFYIKDDDGQVIGFIGVNEDVTELANLRTFLDAKLSYQQVIKDEAGDSPLTISASDMVENCLTNALQALNLSSSSKLKKDDKIRVIAILNEHNMFSLKGVIPIVARRLNISVPTVYRYLNDLKK